MLASPTCRSVVRHRPARLRPPSVAWLRLLAAERPSAGSVAGGRAAHSSDRLAAARCGWCAPDAAALWRRTGEPRASRAGAVHVHFSRVPAKEAPAACCGLGGRCDEHFGIVCEVEFSAFCSHGTCGTAAPGFAGRSSQQRLHHPIDVPLECLHGSRARQPPAGDQTGGHEAVVVGFEQPKRSLGGYGRLSSSLALPATAAFSPTACQAGVAVGFTAAELAQDAPPALGRAFGMAVSTPVAGDVAVGGEDLCADFRIAAKVGDVAVQRLQPCLVIA